MKISKKSLRKSRKTRKKKSNKLQRGGEEFFQAPYMAGASDEANENIYNINKILVQNRMNAIGDKVEIKGGKINKKNKFIKKSSKISSSKISSSKKSNKGRTERVYYLV